MEKYLNGYSLSILKMTDHELRLLVNDLLDKVPGARKEIEKTAGTSLENLPDWVMYGVINTLEQTETLHRQQEREDVIREEQQEFYIKLEQAKAVALRCSLNEAARIIADGNKENTERLEQVLNSINEGAKQLQSGDGYDSGGKSLPSSFIAYTDCRVKHRPTEEHPEGRPGPSQCIETRVHSDGVHYRCLVAFLAQNPQGFARIKYQIFHAELLKQGDCPRPYSRSILHRLPFRISWLLQKPDICPYTKGSEYVIKDGEFVEAPDTFKPPTIGEDTWK